MDHTTSHTGVAYSDEHTDNYHQTLQFPSILQGYCFYSRQLDCFGSPSLLSWASFSAAAGSCFQQKKTLMTVSNLLSIKQHTDKVSDLQVEHVTAKIFPSGVGADHNRAKKGE